MSLCEKKSPKPRGSPPQTPNPPPPASLIHSVSHCLWGGRSADWCTMRTCTLIMDNEDTSWCDCLFKRSRERADFTPFIQCWCIPMKPPPMKSIFKHFNVWIYCKTWPVHIRKTVGLQKIWGKDVGMASDENSWQNIFERPHFPFFTFMYRLDFTTLKMHRISKDSCPRCSTEEGRNVCASFLAVHFVERFLN